MSSHPQELLLPGTVIVDGVERPGGGAMVEHIDPATGNAQQELHLSDPADLDAAVAAARRAQPGWSRTPTSARQALLHRIADLIEGAGPATAQTAALESGTAVGPGSTVAGPLPAASFRRCASRLDAVEGDIEQVFPMRGFDYTRREPDGVIGVLTSPVAPFASAAATVASAIAGGSCVVLAAPALAPFTPVRLVRLCQQAGLPPGVVNVVVGDDAVRDALVRHSGIDKVSVIGSRDDGRRALVAAASHVRPVLLQPRGTSVDIVFADSDPASAASAIRRALLIALADGRDIPTRVLVEASRHDELVGELVVDFERVVVGPPGSPATELGPRSSAAHMQHFLAALREVEGAGARVVGGDRLDGALGQGWFVRPALAVGVADGAVDVPDDVSPLVSVVPFRTEEEAVEMAVAAPATTVARVHTRDLARTHALASLLATSAVLVGDSVVGPRTERVEVEDFLYHKNVYVDLTA